MCRFMFAKQMRFDDERSKSGCLSDKLRKTLLLFPELQPVASVYLIKLFLVASLCVEFTISGGSKKNPVHVFT